MQIHKYLSYSLDRQHELYKFQIHVLPLPPANFVHVTPDQWADHNEIKAFLKSHINLPDFTVYFIRFLSYHRVADFSWT